MSTESSLELRHDDQADRLYWHDKEANETVDEETLSSTSCGCAVEEFGVSPSGRWIVTARWSGQGEWGYDVIQSHPLKRLAGILERPGYILDIPQFAANESYILGGFGEFWLGGWWSHPNDDFYETPSCGGIITFGWLFHHKLPSQEVSFYQLRMDLPPGWIPEDPENEMWMGARCIAPLGNGSLRMTLPGNIPIQLAGPLPETIDLPVPHPDGGTLL